MTTEAEVRDFYRAPPGAWPPNDSEESVVGTDLHQSAISNLRLGINGAARLERQNESPVPWKALTQTLLLGLRRPDASPYRTLPDVFVYPHDVDPVRPSFSIAVDGPPVLIVEVLSMSTYDVDLNIDTGKGYSYASAGVREYLTIDPTRQFLIDGGRGWRLYEGAYQPWKEDAQGRWQSEEIPVAIGLEGVLATVYTRAGRRLLREDEVEETVRRQAEEIKELRLRMRSSPSE